MKDGIKVNSPGVSITPSFSGIFDAGGGLMISERGTSLHFDKARGDGKDTDTLREAIRQSIRNGYGQELKEY